MQFKQLLTDEDAVSPVIGVILMVAITVILAAVIGAFVLGIGGSQTAVPSASFQWGPNGDTVTHAGGDELIAENLDATGGDIAASGTTELTAGDTVVNNAGGSSTVEIIWISPSSDDTNIIGTLEK